MHLIHLNRKIAYTDMKKICFALLLVVFSSPLFAADLFKQCADARENGVEYLRCLDRQIKSVQDKVKLWGNNKLFEIEELSKTTGRRDALHLFKKSQKSFTKHVENNCRWQYLLLLPDTTAAAIIYKECVIKMNHIRAAELRALAKKGPL